MSFFFIQRYPNILIQGLRSPIKLEGDTPELGEFEIQIVDSMDI